MLKIINNPVDIILSVIERKYPEVQERIHSISFSLLDEYSYRVLVTDDDKYALLINPKNTKGTVDIEELSEIIAKAFSNIISGDSDDNSDGYREVYSSIQKGYEEYLDELQENLDEGDEMIRSGDMDDIDGSIVS